MLFTRVMPFSIILPVLKNRTLICKNKSKVLVPNLIKPPRSQADNLEFWVFQPNFPKIALLANHWNAIFRNWQSLECFVAMSPIDIDVNLHQRSYFEKVQSFCFHISKMPKRDIYSQEFANCILPSYWRNPIQYNMERMYTNTTNAWSSF